LICDLILGEAAGWESVRFIFGLFVSNIVLEIAFVIVVLIELGMG
jgi:hypothetical protein